MPRETRRVRCLPSPSEAKDGPGRTRARSGMILVTGGAGFIGSNVVAALNEAGRSDIVVDDVLGSDEKWRNLAKRQIADMIAPADLMRWLDHRKLDAVIHMGA